MPRANPHFLPGHIWHITHPSGDEFQSVQTFNRFAPFITGISPFQSFQTFNRFAPFKTFPAKTGSKRSKVPFVPIVPL
jgi:hypothetical protein